jgi:queuosine precursor transporter
MTPHGAGSHLSAKMRAMHRLTPTARRAWGAVALAVYIGIIVLANWLITRFGAVDVGFGLMAPAAVYAAGAAFTARDIVQDLLGKWWVCGAIVVGAALSAAYASTTRIAVGSGVAFLVSELLDFAVYTPLRERNWPLAVVASNVVGLMCDSVLFLWIAFGNFDFLAGQIVGKTWVTLAFLPLLVVWRNQWRELLGAPA